MNVGQKLASACAVVGVSILVAWVSLGSPEQEPEAEDPPMQIATFYWPGTYWIDVAREKGWFADAGLNAEFVNASADYYGAMDALEDGSIDTLVVWLFDAVKRSQDGTPLVMVLATDQSYGSEGIVSRPSIDSVDELEGGRIGVTRDTALVYELDVILSRFGLTLDDVTLVDMAAENAVDRLKEGDLDAVVTWEPFLSEAEKLGNRLYDSSQLPGLITAGMTFRQSFIEQRPRDIQRMVEVWHRASDYIRANEDEAFAIVAEANGVTPEEVAAFAGSNQRMTLRDNIEAFTYASGLESLFGSARKINRFLLSRAHKEGSPVEGENVLDARFVRQLARKESQR